MENPFEIFDRKLDKICKLLEILISNRQEVKINTPENKEIMNVDEVAAFLFISKSTLYKFVMNRKIPHFKVGGKLYFKRSDLMGWIQEGKVKTMAEIQNEASTYISNRRQKN